MTGVPRPRDDAEDRGLAGAVGAEQREHLARAHLEADVEQHLHRAVGEVDVVDLQCGDRARAAACWRRCSSISSCSSATTSDRSFLMYVELRRINSPPMSVARHARAGASWGAGPKASMKKRGEERAAGRADEEHVDRPERCTHAAKAVGHDRLRASGRPS